MPFRRETFFYKQVLIPFDANFNRLDDNSMRKQYVGKNISELHHTIDSVNLRLDSIGRDYTRELHNGPLAILNGHLRSFSSPGIQSAPDEVRDKKSPLILDSLLSKLDDSGRRMVVEGAMQSIRRERDDFEFKGATMADDRKILRRHEIELLKKYTLSVACLIMFFIGAPLGAIIRKGGIGTPLVISVLLFLVYYIIDNTGYKMARDGRWIVWIGMWLSTAILAPLGIYVTYKAMNDSSVFDKDLYISLLKKIFGTRTSRKVCYKEVIINDISENEAISRLSSLRERASAYVQRHTSAQSYITYWMRGYDTSELKEISSQLEADVAYMADCRNPMAVNKLIDYPVLRILWAYHPARRKWLSRTLATFFPVGIPVWLWGLHSQKVLKQDLRRIVSVSDSIISILTEPNTTNTTNVS